MYSIFQEFGLALIFIINHLNFMIIFQVPENFSIALFGIIGAREF
jgi:hypothetical protein